MTLAKMSIKAPDEYIYKLNKFGNDMPIIAKKMVYNASNPIADDIRKKLTSNIDSNDYVGKGDGEKKNNISTGDLIASFGVANITTDSKGVIGTKIGFKDYDRKNVPNALKARVMESGTSWLIERPFVRPAVIENKKNALNEMNRVLEEELKIYAL